MAVSTAMSGRGDFNVASLRGALDAGWEPFAVADGRIWLRKLEDMLDGFATAGVIATSVEKVSFPMEG